MLFATGGDDPRSSNQTLGGSGSRKSIGLDMAYIDWKFMEGGNLLLGKQVNPIFRPGQSLFYDGDYNPEGGAVKFDRGMFFGSAYGWWVTGELQLESGRREHRLGHLRPAGRHEVPAVRRRDGARG